MRPTTSYRVTVRGRLSERFAHAFDGFALEPQHGRTVLAGRVHDPTELYGLLDRLRDLGLELVRVEEVE